jgi:hypothetical protein
MSFKDKTRNCVYARNSYVQKKAAVQMHTMWANIMVARKKTIS